MKLVYTLLFTFLIFSTGCGGDSGGSGTSNGDGQNTGTQDQSGNDGTQGANNDTPPAAGDHYFDFESAKIVFDYGKNWSGTKTVYIGDNGNQILTIDERQAGDMDMGQTVFFLDGKMTKWSHRGMDSGRGGKADRRTPSKVDTKYILKHAMLHAPLLQGKSADQLTRGVYEAIGEKEVVGKMCQGFKSEAAGTEVWRWKDLELSIHNAAMKSQEHTIEAVSFEEGVAFPMDKCKVPEGYKIEE